LYPFPGAYFAFFNPGYLHIKQAISLVKEANYDKNNIIVDVGGANGYVCSLFAGAFPETKVYSFEPIKVSYDKLLAVSKQYPNIIPINKALGAANSTMDINVAHRVTSSSLFELNADGDDNFITQNISLTRKETIEISTLDTEIPDNVNINLIKIDVQGFEIETLKGALKAMKRTHIILVELANHDYYKGGAKYYEVDEFLRAHDFELLSFIPSLRDKSRFLEWDSIYVNKALN
jgi:FkbM family methyltransferase